MNKPPTTTRPRQTIDLAVLTPASLASLNDEQFRLVVDADIRKGTHHAQEVPAWITEALETIYLDRWYLTLRRALTSVDGQLAARDADFEAERARLAASGDPDAATRVEELGARHHEMRSRSLRFRSGLKDVLVRADSLRNDRVKQLERAIRAHRDAIGVTDPDTTEADRTLWSLISPTE